jgi:hypothetical protein
MSKVLIKPAPGCVLRDHNEDFALIPVTGKDVVLDRLWKKRVKDGDAILPGDPVSEAEPEVMSESVEISIVAAKKKESK